jgi:hypothetical protein
VASSPRSSVATYDHRVGLCVPVLGNIVVSVSLVLNSSKFSWGGCGQLADANVLYRLSLFCHTAYAVTRTEYLAVFNPSRPSLAIPF